MELVLLRPSDALDDLVQLDNNIFDPVLLGLPYLSSIEEWTSITLANMPTLALTDFNIVCATLGGFIALFGLVSYLFKEKLYLSEALVSLIAGVIFSPHATNWIRPLDYALGDEETLHTITLYFTRLVGSAPQV